MEINVELEKRILEIAYKHNLSHLGSYFSSLGIINEIYEQKLSDDVFILSAGHCALALYVVNEKFHSVDAEKIFIKHGGHPHRDEERAIATPDKKVYCLISDGECAEGSIWESLKFIKEQNLQNIEVHVNVNGYCAYDTVDTKYLITRLKTFLPDIKIHKTKVGRFSFLRGLNAHYHIMSEEDYNLALKELQQ